MNKKPFFNPERKTKTAFLSLLTLQMFLYAKVAQYVDTFSSGHDVHSMHRDGTIVTLQDAAPYITHNLLYSLPSIGIAVTLLYSLLIVDGIGKYYKAKEIKDPFKIKKAKLYLKCSLIPYGILSVVVMSSFYMVFRYGGVNP